MEILVLSDEWIHAFTDNNIIINLINANYDDIYLKIVQECYDRIGQKKEKYLQKEESLQKSKDLNLMKFENDILEHRAMCFEEQEYRRQGEMIVAENRERHSRVD